MKICNENEYLISSSLDRTVKIWSLENANYLCSIYTHLIISEIYFDNQTNLMVAIASKLENKKFLAFKLFVKSKNEIGKSCETFATKKLSQQSRLINDQNCDEIVKFFNFS